MTITAQYMQMRADGIVRTGVIQPPMNPRQMAYDAAASFIARFSGQPPSASKMFSSMAQARAAATARRAPLVPSTAVDGRGMPAAPSRQYVQLPSAAGAQNVVQQVAPGTRVQQTANQVRVSMPVRTAPMQPKPGAVSPHQIAVIAAYVSRRAGVR